MKGVQWQVLHYGRLTWRDCGWHFIKISIKTVAWCNRVCKRWHNILSESYFANLHLSRSPACLIIYRPHWFGEYTIYDLVEQDDSPHQNIDCSPHIRFDLDDDFEDGEWPLCGSVNRLIFLLQNNGATCICNPITREYILLPDHKYIRKSYSYPTYGFGFFEASNEYKVVCFYERDLLSTEGSDKSWCEVYTLGTSMWRSLGHVPFLVSAYNTTFRYASSWSESHVFNMCFDSDYGSLPITMVFVPSFIRLKSFMLEKVSVF